MAARAGPEASPPSPGRSRPLWRSRCSQENGEPPLQGACDERPQIRPRPPRALDRRGRSASRRRRHAPRAQRLLGNLVGDPPPAHRRAVRVARGPVSPRLALLAGPRRGPAPRPGRRGGGQDQARRAPLQVAVRMVELDDRLRRQASRGRARRRGVDRSRPAGLGARPGRTGGGSLSRPGWRGGGADARRGRSTPRTSVSSSPPRRWSRATTSSRASSTATASSPVATATGFPRCSTPRQPPWTASPRIPPKLGDSGND
jgi:hypothetical protein